MDNKYLISDLKYKNCQVIKTDSVDSAISIYNKINNIKNDFKNFVLECFIQSIICIAKIENGIVSIMDSECQFKYIKLLIHEELDIGDIFLMSLKHCIVDNTN